MKKVICMIRLSDYVNGKIDVELGFSPIILTFDDGNANNFKVIGRNEDGSLKFDPKVSYWNFRKY